jgi:hypothetical protein
MRLLTCNNNFYVTAPRRLLWWAMREIGTESETPSGLDIIGSLQWGSHFTQLFKDEEDLRDVLVPYFKAGLENNESCLWVTGAPFGANRARSALRAAVSDFDDRERRKQIEIRDAHEWYSAGAKLSPSEIVTDLVHREQDGIKLGYEGLRTNGNCSWVGRDQWDDFRDYESLVQEAVRGRRMLCMCSYCLDETSQTSKPSYSNCAFCFSMNNCHARLTVSSSDKPGIASTLTIWPLFMK